MPKLAESAQGKRAEFIQFPIKKTSGKTTFPGKIRFPSSRFQTENDTAVRNLIFVLHELLATCGDCRFAVGLLDCLLFR